MWYEEALSIGTEVDGVIKCSWAEIYDENGDKIFSLQNRNFERDVIVPDQDSIWDQTDGGDANFRYDNYVLNLAWTTERMFEPVVHAREYRYAYKVPVELTTAARQAIVQIIMLKKEYWKMARYQEFAHGDTTYAADGIHLNKDDKKIVVPGIEAAADKMWNPKIDYFANLGTVYVKPKAFRWYPLNTFAIDGVDVEAAKQEYERSKKILAAAAATIIL